MLFLEYEVLWISLYVRCAVALVLALLYTTFFYGSITVLFFFRITPLSSDFKAANLGVLSTFIIVLGACT